MLLSLKLICIRKARYSRKSFYQRIDNTLAEIKAAGTFKSERVIQSAQTEAILVSQKKVTNFCANNYLGLCNDDSVKAAAHLAIDNYGAGLGSVRFICGTQVQIMFIFLH
jgi:glycine C-acetyltransferase